MTLELWIAFTLASMVLLVIPGPTFMVVISYALSKGRSSARATVPGVALGDFTAMTISVLGAGAVLATSATLFTILKLCGAAYLIWLGIQLWRSNPSQDEAGDPSLVASGRRMFWNTYVVTALNPKSIVFFVAFVPQFVDTALPVARQFLILEATFLLLAATSAAIWALAADRMHSRFQRPDTRRLINKVGGSFLIGAGLLTAATRRISQA